MDIYRRTYGKRGFLGSAEVDVEDYWTEGRGSQQLRCNETVLYAEIDCCQELVAIAKSEEQVQEQYGRMDMFYLCLQAIKLFGHDLILLEQAGIVIGNMVDSGYFLGNFDSLEEENAFVDETVDEMEERVLNFSETRRNQNFLQWYKDNVLDLNYYHNYDGSKTTDAPRLNGLGATSSKDTYSKMAKEGGMYLLYLVTETDGADGNKEQISKKKLKQNKFLQFMHSSGNNVTKQSILANAKSGIVATSGTEPGETLERFKKEARDAKEDKGLGWIITLISAIVTAVVIIVKMVVQAVQAQKAAEAQQYIDSLDMQAPTPEELQGASPEYDDYQKEIENTKNSIADTNASIANTWLWSGVGVLTAGFAGLALVKMKLKRKIYGGKESK